jgi:flagellar protein FliO/FliZ
MDGQLLSMILKIVLFLPFVVLLIYISLKYGGTGLRRLQNGKFIKIIERVPISKENNILVIKMGSKAYVVTSTNNSIEILKELDDAEAVSLVVGKAPPQYKGLKDMYINLKRKGR